jgi:hypothetical protein
MTCGVVRRLAAAFLLAWTAVAGPIARDAGAACNLIPQAVVTKKND